MKFSIIVHEKTQFAVYFRVRDDFELLTDRESPFFLPTRRRGSFIGEIMCLTLSSAATLVVELSHFDPAG